MIFSNFHLKEKYIKMKKKIKTHKKPNINTYKTKKKN
jgi:hypothetical protein